MSCTRILASAVTASVAFASLTLADVIKLRNGGTVHGRIVDEKCTPLVVVVKLRASGGQITLPRSRIQEIIRDEDTLAQYHVVKGQFKDTAQDQFRLALWCEKHQLDGQYQEHLKRVIELDPNHAGARKRLGYVKFDGQWMTPQELQNKKGVVRFHGRFVTEQERDILERKQQRQQRIRQWHKRVRMWKSWLLGRELGPARQAERNLTGIDDPLAVPALVTHLGDEQSEALRELLCRALAPIAGQQATVALVKLALADDSANVRFSAAQRLAERQDPLATETLTKALRSESNQVVRRAAQALGTIGDPAAVLPLINALVTKHKRVVRQGQTGTMFGGSAAVSTGVDVVVAPGAVAIAPRIGYTTRGVGLGTVGRKVVEVRVENAEVLNALTAITDQDFGFDQRAWRTWYASQLRQQDGRAARPVPRRSEPRP